MNIMWISAILTFMGGCVLWGLDVLDGANTFGTFPRYVGTLLPASFLALDLGRRYLPVGVTRKVMYAVATLNAVVLISVFLVNSVEVASDFKFSAVLVAMWGTVVLNIALLLMLLGLGLGMTRSYMKVASGRSRGLGSILIAVGGVSILMPLIAFPLFADWPLIVLPSLLIAIVGQRLLDKE